MSTGGEGHAHDFDTTSGYCSRCGLRDDGRLVDKSGRVFRQRPGYIESIDEQTIRTTITELRKARS